MKKFKVIITTKIESEIEVYANDYNDVQIGLNEDRWKDEISNAQMNWNVVDEETFIDEVDTPQVVKKWARRCDITKEGMNEGYVFRDELYFKYEKDFIKHLRSLGDEPYNKANDEFILSEAYELGEYYWTEWYDEQAQWYELDNGTLIENPDYN